MDGFPFDIVFEELEDKIVIWAVAHTKRFPGYWRERIRRPLKHDSKRPKTVRVFDINDMDDD